MFGPMCYMRSHYRSSLKNEPEDEIAAFALTTLNHACQQVVALPLQVSWVM